MSASQIESGELQIDTEGRLAAISFHSTKNMETLVLIAEYTFPCEIMAGDDVILSFEVQIRWRNLVKVYFNSKESIKLIIFNPIYVKLNDLTGAKLNFICSDKAQ